MTSAIRLSVQILKRLGEAHRSTVYLESGSSSIAYRVVSDRSEYILRVASTNTGKVAKYESDFYLRSLLYREGHPVARPIATNVSLDIGLKKLWAFDEYHPGTHPKRGEIAPLVSRQLGSMLRFMHKLPVSGHGLFENSRTRLFGLSPTPETGMLSRFESPWPFTAVPLDKHPSVRDQPSLKSGIQRLKNELSAIVKKGRSAVIHSDLHEKQLILSNGRLSALLDFNEAGVGRPEWDMGSYLYFHGEKCLNDLLDGYTNNSLEKMELSYRSRLASILIALHHGNRGCILDRPHRIKASRQFLKGILS